MVQKTLQNIYKMIKNIIFNQVTLNGNKCKSEKLVYKSIKKIQKVNNKKNFKDVFKFSVINNSPVFYLKTIKRKRRQNLEFPFMLLKNLRISYSLKFILHYCNSKKKESFYNRLNEEIISSSKKESQSFNHNVNLYKETFVKKKFANYRWF